METMLVFIALVALSSQLAPQLTRREIFFGVTVSASFRDSPVARAVSRRYAVEIWLLAAIAATIEGTSPMPVVSGPMLLGQILGASVAFARARRAVRPYAVMPASVREAAMGPRDRLPGGLLGQLGPFLILPAVAVYVWLHWAEVPARFPTHWNLAGKPDGWTAKSIPGVFRGLAIGVIGCAMTWFTSYAVLRWARLPRVTGQDGQLQRRVRRIQLLALLASAYMLAVFLSWTTVMAMFADQTRGVRLPLALRAAPFVLVIVGTLVIRTMRRTAIAEAPPIGDTTPDSSWILGRLYVNRADPALFVEQRVGLGYRLNLGNPWSWLVVVVFLLALSLAWALVP